ncbi:uncharacterized protein LOC142896692 [Nelusetta ayraudi]|uniref:uncharacterized protein LOC142896692 n=1 Tax=Nelusetta ayraudi TaxID=303726 RepID=UPI003F728AF0
MAPRFNYQEPGIPSHHGSAPHISVTESTPERNRRLLSAPANHLQVPTQQQHSSPIEEDSLEQQEKFMNLINHGQRGRMDDQCCSLDPSRSAPCTPKNNRKIDVNNADSDKFFNLLANTQSRRLDDQRVSLPSLPGLQKEQETSTSGSDSSYLCYMVSKVQGSRMEDQRCSLPQIVGKQSAPKEDSLCPTRSASFNTSSDIERPRIKEKPSEKQVFTESDQDTFLNIMSKSQRGRMDEQRCTLNISPKSTPTHRPTQDVLRKDADPEKFFSLLANSQGRRLDDQRLSMPALPGIQNGNTKSNSASEADAGNLCNVIGKAQGSRMDDQRCSAPQILQNLSSPSPRHKSPSVPDTSEKHQQEPSAADQQQFLKIISHAQRGRMDEQRCSLQPSSAPASPVRNGSAINNTCQGADSEALFNIISSSQGRRMDDQRVTLPSLPGISGNTERKGKASPPHVVVAESTPTVSRRGDSRPPTQPLGPCGECGSPRPIPKSASFTLETEHQRMQNSQAQMTVKVSMSFTPQMGHKNMEHLGSFPEVFLTVGAPGDNLVIPLSPVAGRPLSLNLNLVPKEGAMCSSNRASPRRAHSRPSTPNKRASPIGPDEDCLSVIEKVHTAQLQKKATPGQKQKKGKGGAKKDKKDSSNK